MLAKIRQVKADFQQLKWDTVVVSTLPITISLATAKQSETAACLLLLGIRLKNKFKQILLSETQASSEAPFIISAGVQLDTPATTPT